MAARIARELLIHGRVQGVFFRAFVSDAARRAGVAGWAANRADGTVAVRLEGEPAAVDAVERSCASGPKRARVDRVERSDAAVAGLSTFSVR